MRIFLTGGTGFIGSHFINGTKNKGYVLNCLKRPGSQPRINLIYEPNWNEGFLSDDLTPYLKDCDLVLHLAAHSSNTPYDSLENCLKYNLNDSLNFLECAKKVGIKKYIIIGSGFEYGQSGEDYKYIPTNAPLKPISSYAVSKAASCLVFNQWAIENELKLKYLRLFHVYGEGEDENRLWPALKKAAFQGEDFSLTPAEQVRNFSYVKNIVDQLLNALNFNDVKFGEPKIKNIGSKNTASIKNFAKYWWKKWNAKGTLYFDKVPYRKNEIMRFVPEL